MTGPSAHDVTRLLLARSAGDPQALEKLTPLVSRFLTFSRLRLADSLIAG
jgi:hypothetical protein